MKYPRLLKATKSAEVLAVIENLPVSANGYFMEDSQMEGIESSLTQAEADAAALLKANGSVTELQGKLTELGATATAPADSVTKLSNELEAIKTDRDAWKVKAEALGSKTEAPKETSKAADSNDDGLPKPKNSMDLLAERRGVGR